MKYLCWAILSCCMAMSLSQANKLSDLVRADGKCTATQQRAWGAGYAGSITFKASSCYNDSYTAIVAVGNTGYYCGKAFTTSDCSGEVWWMEFTKAVQLSKISFGEGAGKLGGKFRFWGYSSGQKNRETLSEGTTAALSKWTGTNGKKFNAYGLDSKSCTMYAPTGQYYPTIKDFKFTVKF